MPEDKLTVPQDTENQVVTSVRRNLEYDVSDEELLLAVNRAILESQELKSVIDEIGKINKRYWKVGTRDDVVNFHKKKANITNNRIFTDIETAIPILTSEPPEPTVIGATDNALQETLQKGLQIAYEVKYKLQQKVQCLIRHWFLFRIGILKYRWDINKGFRVENVLPRKIGFDKRATSIYENCEYAWEELENTIENIIKKFPKKKKEIEGVWGGRIKTKVKYTEFWGGGGAWLCWKFNNTILDKKKNPNFDYENAENNLFEQPQFPYILLTVFTLGGDETGLYDETSLVEESSSMQEGVNKLERQILDLNEGQKRVWTASGEAISYQKFQELLNATGDFGVYYDRKAPANALNQVQSGKPDASLFNNLTHLLSEIDNTMGIHSTTRGERAQQETLGGRQLLMGSDYGRLDLIVRNEEQVIEELFNAYLHMLKVYATEAEVLDNGKEKVELRAEEIPQGIQIMIKKGSTLPIDRRTKMEQAIKLTQADRIDPQTLFEEMGYPNAEERAQKLIQWLQMTGKIAPQQPQIGQGGAGGVNTGQEEQLVRLQDIMQSPQFQGLPDEEKANFIQKSREIVENIKAQGGAPQ